jgi:hypothetical protein
VSRDHVPDLRLFAARRRAGKKINNSTVLAGRTLGAEEVDAGIWLASFMHYDLG